MKINVKEIIKKRSIEIQMQVVLSPNKDIAAGVEALSRGVSLVDNSFISPYELMQEARKQNLGIELEELLIEKSMEAFLEIYTLNPELLLFINISHDYIEHALDSDFICNCTEKYKINNQNIVFDLLPFEDTYYEIAEKFSMYHKDKGFYICIDDIGVNYCNLDKVIFLNPDMIKINRYKYQELKNPYYKEFMQMFLKNITNHLGILVVDKGIESEIEFIESLKSGAQFVQGFYVSKPEKLTGDNLAQIISDFRTKVDESHVSADSSLESNRGMVSRVINIMKEIVADINYSEQNLLISNMNFVFDKYQFIENAWILNKNGTQVYDSFINYKNFNIKNSPIFHIYKDGSDFKSKEIYSQLMDTILDVWVTKPFKSILTNNVCISGSTYINNLDSEYIFCMNVNYEQIVEYMKKS